VSLRDAIAAGSIGEVEVVACLYAAVAREIFRASRIATGPDEEPPLISPQRGTYADPKISGGGQGQTLTTHTAALLIWLLGRRAVEVHAVVDRHELDVDLVNAIIVRFEGGALATILSTGSLPEGEPESLEVRLFGSAGDIHLDVSGGRASIHARGTVAVDLPDVPEAARLPEWAPASNLVDIVLGRGPNGSPAWLGVAAVELVDAMYRSAAEGRPVRIDQIA
jgi:predicted dehydrogenase